MSNPSFALIIMGLTATLIGGVFSNSSIRNKYLRFQNRTVGVRTSNKLLKKSEGLWEIQYAILFFAGIIMLMLGIFVV